MSVDDMGAGSGAGTGEAGGERPEQPERSERLERATASLRGLSVGDALGAACAARPARRVALEHGELPDAPWRWTDDTETACSVLTVLAGHGHVDQDALAASLARRHDASRYYGSRLDAMLLALREGADWRELAAALFDGRGSWGNGAAMRVAPLGAWFAGEPERALEEAEASAFVTHQHREAVVGAMAVAGAAALAAGGVPGAELPARLAGYLPRSAVTAGLRRAGDMLDYGDVGTVAAVLGCGRRTSAQDTVPFALWAAARHLGDFTGAVGAAVRAGGDMDTTCAIAGGVVAAGGPAGAPPAEWARSTEDLPAWLPAPAS